MKVKFAMTLTVVVASLAAPVVAHAQGIIGGGKQGVARGQRVAGPVGAVVGGVVGGAVGGVVGGVKGVIGIPQEAGWRRRLPKVHGSKSSRASDQSPSTSAN